MIHDLYNRVAQKRLFDPVAAITNDGPTVSQIVDCGGYESVVLQIITGNLTDADAIFSVKVEDGNDAALADAALVAATDLQIDPGFSATPGSASYQMAFDFAADNKQLKIGYKGGKRYLRVTVQSGVSGGANTGNLFMAGAAVLSNARHQPAGATQTP